MRATLILSAAMMMAFGACDQARPEHAMASLSASPDTLLDELRRMRPAASSAAPADAPLRCCGSASGRAAVEAALDLHDALAAGGDGLSEGYALSAAMGAFAADPLTPEASRALGARAATTLERARDRGPTALREALAARRALRAVPPSPHRDGLDQIARSLLAGATRLSPERTSGG